MCFPLPSASNSHLLKKVCPGRTVEFLTLAEVNRCKDKANWRATYFILERWQKYQRYNIHILHDFLCILFLYLDVGSALLGTSSWRAFLAVGSWVFKSTVHRRPHFDSYTHAFQTFNMSKMMQNGTPKLESSHIPKSIKQHLQISKNIPKGTPMEGGN